MLREDALVLCCRGGVGHGLGKDRDEINVFPRCHDLKSDFTATPTTFCTLKLCPGCPWALGKQINSCVCASRWFHWNSGG